MTFRPVFFLLFFFLFSFSCLAQDIPFTIEKGYVIVPVKVRNNISVEMIVNTGLAVSLIDGDAAKKNNFPAPAYTSVGQVTGRNDQIIVFNDVSDVSIGGEKVGSLLMEFTSLAYVKSKIGRDIFGILGADFLKGKSIRFNFKNKTLSFPKQSDTQGTSGSTASKSPVVYKMSQVTTNAFGKEIMLPVSNEVNINGKKIKTLFDTGTIPALLIFPSASKELNIDSPEKDQTTSFQIKSLNFSDYNFNDIPATVFGKDAVPENYKKGFGAIVGVAILQNFIVTFDYKKSLVILEQ